MKNMRIRSGGLAGVRRAIGSGFILATDSARKSGDLGMHGLVKIVDFAENPYTRASVKASLKFSRSTLRLSKKSFNIGKKILGKIRSPFNGKVSGKIKNVLDVITWTARKLKQIVNAIRSLVAKLALILGGFYLTIFMFIIILDKNFDPGGRYDRVFTNLEVEDNTKELMSMMTVRFEQDIVEYHTPNEVANGKSLSIPSGLGKLHTYMGWSTITSKTSKKYKLRSDAGEKYDNEGFDRIGDRYIIACSSTFGRVGDYVDFYQSDGSVIKGIIGDIKNPNDGFDGSGLVYYIFNESGIYEFDSRPTLKGLAKMSIPIKEKDAKFGDLVSWLGI